MIEYTVRVNTDGNKFWYLNNKLHREDGPAVEFTNGDKFWYLNGVRHREDGPAVEVTNGNKAWYLNGERHTEEEFNKKTQVTKELSLKQLEELLGYSIKIVKD